MCLTEEFQNDYLTHFSQSFISPFILNPPHVGQNEKKMTENTMKIQPNYKNLTNSEYGRPKSTQHPVRMHVSVHCLHVNHNSND